MNTYAAWWPIHDDTRTLTDLITEATPLLTDLTTEAGLTIAGDVQWGTDERDAGLVLMAVAPVWVDAPAEVEAFDDNDAEDDLAAPRVNGLSRGRPSADTAEDVEFLLDSDRWMLPENVADRLGVKTEAVYRALARAGRNDLRDQLIQNSHEAGARLSAEKASSRRVA